MENKWDSEKYLKFEKERTQPAIDLAKRIEGRNMSSVLDVGCGPGNSSIVIKNIFPNADIWGIDFSAFDEDITKPLIAACFRNGLIVERVGRNNSVLKLMPPLVIEDELLIKGLEIIKKSIQEII